MQPNRKVFMPTPTVQTSELHSTGRCHICWKHAEILLCSACQHWFCAECREKWTTRAFEAVKALLKPMADCCGPKIE